MVCRNCGAVCPDDAKFCNACGTDFAAPAEPVAEPWAKRPAEVPPKQVLVFGILGLAFACSYYLSFLGIIFSTIGKNKAKQHLASTGVLTGTAKVGSILAKIGFIVGIAFTALLALLFLVGFISALI